MRLKIKKTGSFKASQKYLDLIANSKVYDVAIDTPISFAASLSSKLKNEVFLKREDLQPIFSFKIRGAYNKISNLSVAQQKRGVLTASAGNHAQGVAISCKLLKIKGTIFMPSPTPNQKIEQVKMFGEDYVEVVLIGDTFDDAYADARLHQEDTGKIFIPPFDDQKIIEGQATVGKEIYEQENGHIDYVFILRENIIQNREKIYKNFLKN